MTGTIAMLEDEQEAIADLCRRCGVARLFLLGSALGDDVRPGESDVDLLVEFAPMDPNAKAHAYFDLLDELRSLLGMDVDLARYRNGRVARSAVERESIIVGEAVTVLAIATHDVSVLRDECARLLEGLKGTD